MKKFFYNTQIRVLNSKLPNLLFLFRDELNVIYKGRKRRKFCVWSQFACKTSARARESKVKAKCTAVQELRLCTGFMAHRGSRGIALLYRN